MLGSPKTSDGSFVNTHTYTRAQEYTRECCISDLPLKKRPIHVLELVYRCQHGEFPITVPLPLLSLILQEYKKKEFRPPMEMLTHV